MRCPLFWHSHDHLLEWKPLIWLLQNFAHLSCKHFHWKWLLDERAGPVFTGAGRREYSEYPDK